jgi:hypothetical protein
MTAHTAGRLSVDQLYPALLDAWITEHTSLGRSRSELRSALEQKLDTYLVSYEEKRRQWGRQMSRGQYERLKASSKSRGGDG